MCSTPTVKGLSRIEAAFLESDQRYYYVPCPECDHKQKLVWKNVIWEEDKPETARYACENCGSLIDESKKQIIRKFSLNKIDNLNNIECYLDKLCK